MSDQASFNFTQAENLNRVSGNIAPHILRFLKDRGVGAEFRMSSLHDYINTVTGGMVAPASADRILRDLRQKGQCNYKVINRRQSLYRIEEP